MIEIYSIEFSDKEIYEIHIGEQRTIKKYNIKLYKKALIDNHYINAWEFKSRSNKNKKYIPVSGYTIGEVFIKTLSLIKNDCQKYKKRFSLTKRVRQNRWQINVPNSWSKITNEYKMQELITQDSEQLIKKKER